MKKNVKPVNTLTTYEGGKAVPQTALLELTRAVSSCMLWENTFYESGNEIASRIAKLCDGVPNMKISELAIRARNDLHLRHVPLWLVVQLIRKRAGGLVRYTMGQVIQRPDEITELLSLYWMDGKKHVTRQMRGGIADAFQRFNAYQLKKWDREGKVRLRDALFLSHAKPRDEAQAAVFKQLIDGTLPAAQTWEEKLSAGADKKTTFTDLLTERKLGFTALRMNLRNMEQAGVDRKLIREALLDGASRSKELPFQFIAAAKAAPSFTQELSDAMLVSVAEMPKLEGKTLLFIDVSGSMNSPLSLRGTTTRIEAAVGLGILLREICEDCRVFCYTGNHFEAPNIKGLGLMDAIRAKMRPEYTYLSRALKAVKAQIPTCDRIVVITDEQSADGILDSWADRGAYLLNVSSDRPALNVSGGWTRISGFSERIVEWIRAEEGAVELV